MSDTELNERAIKRYYIEIERYDWITDTKYPEKLFHIRREQGIIKWVNKYGYKANILDVGCGTGLITRHIDSACVVALDINQWAVRRVKAHISDGVECVVGDAENLPLTSSIFDMVICTDVLEHLPNPRSTLKEIFRVMKVGAVLIGEVPSRNLIWKFRRYLTTTCPISEPFHHNYSIIDLKLLLSDFTIVTIRRSAFGLELLFVVQKPNPGNDC